MKEVIYKGKPCKLGKHGNVKKHDLLFMTETEWLYVSRNEPDRFKLASQQEISDINKLAKEAKEVSDAAMVDSKNKLREHLLDKDLNDMAKNRLLEEAQALREKGYVIHFTRKSGTTELRRAIKDALSREPATAKSEKSKSEIKEK